MEIDAITINKCQQTSLPMYEIQLIDECFAGVSSALFVFFDGFTLNLWTD